MKSYQDNISKIISRNYFEEISDAEKALLDQWIATSEENREVYERLMSSGEIIEDFELFELFENQKKSLPIPFENKRKYYKIIFNVVSTVAVVGTLLLLYPLVLKDRSVEDFSTPPLGAQNKAKLVLSNGDIINIEEQRVHINETGKVIASDGKQLIYEDDKTIPNIESPIYNTLKIPVGSTFCVVLSDGSRITLNSHSEIRYPVSFNNDKREVFLDGEAYFNVTADDSKPFIVHTQLQKITVLGTQFNISAYPDDTATVTTLVEGSVQIESGKNKVVIHPGIIAVADGKSIQTMSADTFFYTSWINNNFAFHDESLMVILHKFERWYDLKFEIENPTAIIDKTFTGYIPRYKDIDDLFKVLEISMGISFKREQNTMVKVTL